MEAGKLFDKLLAEEILKNGAELVASFDTEEAGLEHLAEMLSKIPDSGSRVDAVAELNITLDEAQSPYRVRALANNLGTPTVLVLLCRNATRSYAAVPGRK